MKALNTFVAAGLLALLSSGAHAAAISGEISFALVGEWLDTSGTAPATIGTAGGVDVVNDEAIVTTATGDFSAISAGVVGGAIAEFYDFMFNPASTPIDPLWSVTDSGQTFSFVLDTINIVSQTATFLNLTGSGLLSGDGFDDTFASWTFTSSDASEVQFIISSQSTTTVPEPAIVGLLGLGMAGIGFAASRRRQTTA